MNLTHATPSSKSDREKKKLTGRLARGHKKEHRGRKQKISVSRLVAEWKSDLSAEDLARWFGVTSMTIHNWARRYGLRYHFHPNRPKDRTALKSYSLKQAGLRGFEITFPRYVVDKLELKAGDKLRFEVKGNKCIVTKANEN